MASASLARALALLASISLWTLLAAYSSLVRAEATRTLAKCDKACNDLESPLCGTNGVTYNNYCFYLIAACKNKTLEVAYTAACENDDGEDEEPTPAPKPKPTTKKPTPATKAPTAVTIVIKNAVKSEEQAQEVAEAALIPLEDSKEEPQVDYCAMKCASTATLVCGSDGHTYTNECILLAAKCTSPKLRIASKGECSEDKPKDECAKFCTREYEPVCGSDDVTYGNECTFDEANCRADGSLKIVAQCACPETPKLSSDGTHGDDKAGVKCGKTQCEPPETCVNDNRRSGQFCAELCDEKSKTKHCKRHELCVLQQVACLAAPCPKLPSCVKV